MSTSEITSIPSWFCPFKIPPSLSGSFHPLVYLVGLDISLHRNVWESLNLQNVTKNVKLVYKIVPIGHKFPPKATKHDPAECYLPHGIIKSNWVSKHLNDVPAVCIIFFDLNWSSADWNERKQKCAQQIKLLKAEANPHGTQVLVMLIKNDMRDDLTNEKASALCAEAEILPKHLFVLPQGRLDKIQTCLQRLEYETDLYYKTLVKKIMNIKEKATHTPLIVRYNFKIAFYQEVRTDFEAALNHYQGAYDALLNVKMTEANVQELKVVASLLNYRMCRLILLTSNSLPNNLKDCRAQFDKHIRSYYKLEGSPDLIFEHWAWLEQQYHLFGELLKYNYMVGSNFPDPVSYFLVASNYASKRKLFYLEKIKPKDIKGWSQELLPYKRDVELSYLGQRPWRQDSFSLENVFVVEDPQTVSTLTYLESQTNQSDAIIKHLGVASEFCKDTKRKRTRCQLMTSMGIEFYSAGDYKNCILLMRHVLREWSYKKWNKIIVNVAEYGLRASCCDGDVANYLNFLIILLKVDISDQDRNTTNLLPKFQAVMEGKMPIIEEGCEIHLQNWNDSLNNPFVSSVEVHDNCILNFNVYFVKDSIIHVQPAAVRFELTNQSDFPISVRKYGILRTNIPDYCNIEETCDITLVPGETRDVDLQLKVFSRDIGKILQIQVAYVDIGKENRSVILHNTLVLSAAQTTWIDDSRKEKLKLRQTSCRIEAPKPSLEVKMKREGSLLVNEWYKINVSWNNKDETDYSRLMCTYMLSATDIQRAILTPDPEKKSTPGNCIYTTKVDKVVASGTVENTFYIKTLNPSETELRLAIEGKYFDGQHQPLIVKYEESVDVLGPFDVSQTICNLQANKIDHISVGDEFCLSFAIQNISKTILCISSCSLNIKSSAYIVHDSEKQKEDVILKDGEKMESLFFLRVTDVDRTSFGHLEIVWNRSESVGGFTTRTEVPLIPLVTKFSPLYLQATFSNNGRGKLKTPMLVCYTILNRSVHVHDITVSMDSSESFMNGGPKKVTMRLKSKEEMDFSYILFPLVTGCVPVPKLIIESSCSESGEGTAIDTIDVPKSIFVTP